jgi:putative methyltransferase (TIGR04325 family)
MTRLTEVVHAWIPPALLKLLRRFLKVGIWYQDGYKSWDEAKAASSGYESDEIVSKVLEVSLLASEKGLYERDGFILKVPDFNPYTWIAILESIQRKPSGRKFRIVDFGGAFGSTYRVMKDELHFRKIDFEWIIIEQKNFVSLGMKHFQTDELFFKESLQSLDDSYIDLLLFNSVLEYLPDPYQLLSKALSLFPNVVLIDRTPINSGNVDTFSVQHVPKSIYPGAYANRNFCEDNLLKPFADLYNRVLRFECELQPDPRNTSIGMIFIRKNS